MDLVLRGTGTAAPSISSTSRLSSDAAPRNARGPPRMAYSILFRVGPRAHAGSVLRRSWNLRAPSASTPTLK